MINAYKVLVVLVLVFFGVFMLASFFHMDDRDTGMETDIVSPLTTDWRSETSDSIDAHYTAFRSSYMNDGTDLVAAYEGPLMAELTALNNAEIIRYLTIPVIHECLLKSTIETKQQCFTDLAVYEVAVSEHTQTEYDTYYGRCQTTYPDQRNDQLLMSSCALAYFTNLDRCELFFVAGVLDYDWCVFARNEFNQNYFDTKLAALISDVEKGNESIGESDTAQRVHAGALALPELLRQYGTSYREQRRLECELKNWQHMNSDMSTSWIEACSNNILSDYDDVLNRVRDRYFSTYPLEN